MGEGVMETLFKYLLELGTVALPILILIFLLFFPEKIEKWSALLWKYISYIRVLCNYAHKKHIKHDLQGRVNDFVKRTKRKVPDLSDDKLNIQWIDVNQDRSGFIGQGKVVLRLRHDDPEDHNFVHGAYLFISTCLLYKPKRYLSKTQREAMDLFVCTKLLEEEKISVVGIFLDNYLHPKTINTKSKVALCVDDYSIIDKGGFFFSLLLQELGYLGDKVFGQRRTDLIVKEMSNLITFLKPIATRKMGHDNGDFNFHGEYCRFGIVICGKPEKLSLSIEPYVKYINSKLLAKNIETIYLLARAENYLKVNQICDTFEAKYECVRRVKFKKLLVHSNSMEKAAQYMAILRLRGIEVIQPS